MFTKQKKTYIIIHDAAKVQKAVSKQKKYIF